jgi:hypothetical protein
MFEYLIEKLYFSWKIREQAIHLQILNVNVFL